MRPTVSLTFTTQAKPTKKLMLLETRVMIREAEGESVRISRHSTAALVI